MENLTAPQKRALKYIHKKLTTSQQAPTLRELCDYMGYKAVGSVQDVIAALRKKGFISDPKQQKARSLSLTQKAKKCFSAVVRMDDSENFFNVPCLGSVPAGDPIEAIEEHSETLQVSQTLFRAPFPKADKLFALRTDGLSMVQAGIFDGDWLIASSQQESDVGSVVIARLSEDEVTCKRLMYSANDGWYLKPENPDFEPIYASEQSFQVIAKVVALQRSFS